MTPGEDYVNEVLRWLNRVTYLRLGDTAAPDVFRVKEGPVMVLTSAFAATVVCRCHLGTGEYPWIRLGRPRRPRLPHARYYGDESQHDFHIS
jgi:hypothetical protein